MVRKMIYSQVEPNSTVLQMMQKIHIKKGIPIHQMQLTFNNQQLEEDSTLAHYGITHGSEIVVKSYSHSGDCPCDPCKQLEEKVTIVVTWIQKSIRVDCKLGEPVESLKNAIWQREKIPVAKQKLSFNGVVMKDHKLLASYSLRDAEAGGAEPVVHMFVDSGDPTVFDKLRATFSFKRTKSASALSVT